MVKALDRAERLLTIIATFASPPAKREKNLPSIIKKGAPGGCPTMSLYAEAMYSPQSQKLTVGSTPNRYTVAAIKNTIQPVVRLINLNLSIVKGFCLNIVQ
mgnify:CR=1 FL=1